MFAAATLILLFMEATTAKLSLEQSKTNLNLAAVVDQLIEKMGGKVCQALNIVSATESFDDYDMKDLQHKILIKGNQRMSATLRIEIGNNMRINPNRLKKCAFVLVDTFEGFMKFYETFSLKIFKINGFLMLLLVKGKLPEIPEMFKLMWKLKLSNVNVLYEETSGNVSVWTFLPFQSDDCESTKPVKLMTLSPSKQFQLNDFFLRKLRNLNRCQVRVGTADNNEPYNYAVMTNGSYKLHGRDIKLIEALAELLNFKINYSFVGDVGILLDNGTAKGALSELIQGRVDLIISDYWLKSNRLKYFDSTHPYVNQYIAFIVPVGRKFSSLEKLYKSFSSNSWILIAMVFTVACFVIVLIENFASTSLKTFVFGTKVRSPQMNLLVGAFGSSSSVLPRRNFARFLLMMFLLKCLVLRTIYQGSMFKMLQGNAHQKEVQTINEILERKLTFHVSIGLIDFFESYEMFRERQVDLDGKVVLFIDDFIDRIIIFDREKDRNNLMNQTLDSSFNGTVVIPHVTVIFDNVHRFKTPGKQLFRTCREKFLTLSSVIFTQKYFFLMDALNEKIRWLQENGLIQLWNSEIIGKDLQDAVVITGPKVLRIRHLIGVFQIWSCGCLIAFVALLCEMLINYLRH